MLLSALAAFLLSGQAVEAQDPPPEVVIEPEVEVPATVEAEEDIVVEGAKVPKPKMICKKERPTGSGIARKICRTEAQIAQDAKDARSAHGNVQRRQDGEAAARLGSR